MNPEELRAKRAELVQRGEAIFAKIKDEKRDDMTEAEEKDYAAIDAEITALDQQIVEAEAAEAKAAEEAAKKAAADAKKKADFEAAAKLSRTRSASLSRSAGRVSTPTMTAPQQQGPTIEQRALAIQGWCIARSMHGGLTDRHREACDALEIDPMAEGIYIRLVGTSDFADIQDAYRNGPPEQASQRAMAAFGNIHISADGPLSTQYAALGGALMPPASMLNRIEIAMLKYNGISQVAETIRTTGREPLQWPTVNDTGNIGRRIGENQPVVPRNPVFAAMVLNVYKYTSDEILVPYELLNGSPLNLVSIIGKLLGQRIGRKMAVDFTTGDGGSEPRGIVTAASTVQAASATAISWGDLMNLITAVDPEYRDGAGFMMHDSIRAYIMNIRDGNGRPYWAPASNSSDPGPLLGYPVYNNQAMASAPASGAKTVLFGQLSNYKIRQVEAIRLYRLQERHRENDQDAFLAFQEADGNLLDAGTGPVKVLLHP